jgi:hypothetical protein
MTTVDSTARHLRLLTETIAAVNSSFELQEVLELVASKVANALGTDACFVYLYDERADELVLRATFGTRVEELTRTPRMRPGEGITGVAAAERAPVMIAAQAHLDARFKQFPNLPEDEYESILAVPILARDTLEGAPTSPTACAPYGRRDRAPRRHRLAGRADDRAREALRAGATSCRRARGARSDLGGGVRVALSRGVAGGDREDDDGVSACDGRRARARGREDRMAGRSSRRVHVVWLPLRWKRRQIGELVCDRDTPFSADDEARSRRSRTMQRLHWHGKPSCAAAFAQEIHHRVKATSSPGLAPPAAGARRERRCAQVAETRSTGPAIAAARSPHRASRGRR